MNSNYINILLMAEIREYIDKNTIIFFEDVEEYILEEKKLDVSLYQIDENLKRELIRKKRKSAKNNITNRVRQYVIIHDYEVTNEEVIKFVKSKISTARDDIIRILLYRFMKKEGVKLRHKGVSQLVRDYYYSTDNPTSKEARKYVLEILPKANINSINVAFSRLKRNG